MDYSFGFWFFATLAAIAVGLGKGGLPVVAALAVPSLSLYMSPIAAAGLLLPVYIVSDAFALIAYRRDFNRQVLKIAAIGMTLGVAIGSVTAHLIIEWLITVLIGLMGGLFALRMLTQRSDPAKKPIHMGRGLFWTTIAGFTSFISHNGGPPWQIFILPLKLQKSVFRRHFGHCLFLLQRHKVDPLYLAWANQYAKLLCLALFDAPCRSGCLPRGFLG